MGLLTLFRAATASRTARDLRHYEAMFGNLPISSGEILVDVGAGDGDVARKLGERSIRVVSLDYGYREIPPVTSPKTEFSRPIAGLSSRLPLKENVATCVVASHILMHMRRKDVDQSILECIRVARPGGTVLLGPVRKRRFDRTELPEHTTFRPATHLDGYGRPLSSIAINIPEDKSELAPDTSRTLAKMNLFGDLDMVEVAMLALDRFLQGDNRVHSDTAYKLIELSPPSSLPSYPGDDQPTTR
ncbi:MAG TPA: methyltransferase domain-containing protein [Verrucomicrobiae bacterium]|nr:methyltransferase domain-containing protein [Verrucomicrobiae bacterium]